MNIVFVPLYKGPTIFRSPPSPRSAVWLVWGILNGELGRTELKICWVYERTFCYHADMLLLLLLQI